MKTKPETTFWLARDKVDNSHVYQYVICEKEMELIGNEFFRKNSCVSTISSISDELRQRLGLPTLRKGQQVQIKRTVNGFEIVKGNKDEK